MSTQPRTFSSQSGEQELGYEEQLSPPGETTAQGDPAAQMYSTRKERNIIIIPPSRLSDLNLVNYLLQKQQMGYLVQTHISTKGGRIVLGVRAYQKSMKSPAHVAFIVLETAGEFAGQFNIKDRALQAQVYGVWNTPAEYREITEKLRKIIPGVIPVRSLIVKGRRREFLDGERLSVAQIFSRERERRLASLHKLSA